jgi:hypothetical protein
MNSEYIILTSIRDIKSNEIFRLRKSKVLNLRKFNTFEEIILITICSNCDIMKKKCLKLFNKNYLNCHNLGFDCFIGDRKFMINDIIRIISEENKEEIKEEISTIHITEFDENENNLEIFIKQKCNDNINYETFVERMIITDEIINNYEKLGFESVLNLLKKEVKKYNIYNIPFYSILNNKKNTIVKIKTQNIWKSYSYNINDVKGIPMPEIFLPIINKIDEEMNIRQLESYCCNMNDVK